MNSTPENTTTDDDDSAASNEVVEAPSAQLASAALPEYQTPGKVLRDMRENQGLNRAKVGERLGLTETAVRHLENNNFDYFPGSVYLRGYLKNYARLLGESEEQVIAIYDRYCADHGLDTGKSTMAPIVEKTKLQWGFSVLLGAIALIVIAIAWFLLTGTSA